MAVDAQRQTVVDVVGRGRVVCDMSDVMSMQIDRFAHSAPSTAVATREVVAATCRIRTRKAAALLGFDRSNDSRSVANRNADLVALFSFARPRRAFGRNHM